MTAKLLLGLIRLYQVTLSPYTGGCCRFEPSCSRYAAQAIREHGAVRGTWLGICRLARCHPLGRSGYDPVPTPAPHVADEGGAFVKGRSF
jgi:putative membrane protein insertion efficiency factor